MCNLEELFWFLLLLSVGATGVLLINNDQKVYQPIEIKPFYKIGGEIYKPVNFGGCLYMDSYRKTFHYGKCPNKTHRR